MSAPDLQVYVTGSGTVTGDGLNTFCQTCDTAAQLRGLVGVQGMQVFIRGTTAPNDGGAGNFYWNVNGTAPDDNGITTVVPYGSGSGEWTRLVGSSQFAASGNNPAVIITATYIDPNAPNTVPAALSVVTNSSGNNSTFTGGAAIYALAADISTVTTANKGVLYSGIFDVGPIVGRNNPPNDDANCLIATNSGTAKATSAIFIGQTQSLGVLNPAFNSLIELEANAVFGIIFDSDVHIEYGIDFSLPGTNITVPIRLGNNTNIFSRNAANNEDLGIIGLNNSDEIIIGSCLTLSTVSNNTYLQIASPSSDVITIAPFTVGATLQISGLPSSSSGLPTGTLWNDSGTVHVA